MIKNVFLGIVFACLIPCSALADCNEQLLRGDASSRYILNKDEAFDKATGLIWRRCSEGTSWNDSEGCIGSVKLLSLDEAKSIAKQLGNGWRVPTIDELYSIVDEKCQQPVIDPVVFPGVKDQGEGASYWSCTHVEEIPTLIYYVEFMSGIVDAHSKGFGLAVRFVRDKE
ncbi:DUF1566 domain-containing protein [Desulfovibrio inopinatus]|uniref:Lcl C-terminal domain-containing protein n=1 Tax=Desulfovibrio inopinatus TaxID=102109 RepID=UPI00040DA84F|nr:DUF1566 domain-containing protein [Desulfovibrio inopinatus]